MMLLRDSAPDLLPSVEVTMQRLRNTPAISRATSIIVKNIVVPTDFSDVSTKAVRLAAFLARKYGSFIEFVHILQPEYYMQVPAIPLVGRPIAPFDSIRLARLAAETKAGKLRESGYLRGIPHQISLKKRIAGSARLAELIIPRGADIIVMASHGISGLHKYFTGSVVEETLRRSYCPVLIVGPKRQANRPANICNIVYAAKAPWRATRALSWTTWLAADFKAQGTLLELDSTKHKAFNSRQVNRASGPPGLNRAMASGTMPDAVLRFAKKSECDLIVVGLHSQHKGSIRDAYQLICKAPCPVLAVRVSLKALGG